MTRKTRYPELGYDTFGPGHWQFVHTETGAQIGPVYGTKIELLCDLERFYKERFAS